jgi:uncharacterized protein
VSSLRKPLRINVGFLIHEEVGYSHDFPLRIERIVLGPDLELFDLDGLLSVGRAAQGLLFTGHFSAWTGLDCVRCLQPFNQKLDWSMTELYAFNEKSVSDSDLIVPEDAQIDLQPLIRDYALLDVPISPICRPDCKGLCPVCGQDLNVRDCGHCRDSGTSTFAALRDLLPR